MIKKHDELQRFEAMQVKSKPPDYAAAARLFEAMWLEACELGVLPAKDPLDGIDADIRLARILNTCSRNF